MKISIIIPIYNVELYIVDCIQSVINQTYTDDLECILVDDCGMDRSLELAENLLSSYCGPIHFSIIHHEHNKGLSCARNTGMRAATGDYILFLDSDDEITPDCVETLAKPLKENCYDVVVGDVKIIGSDTFFSKLHIKQDTCYRGKQVQKSLTRGEIYSMAWNKLYRRLFIAGCRLSFKEGLIHEDLLWDYMVRTSADSIYVLKHTTYIYRIRENSTTTNFKVDVRINSYRTILAESYKFAHDKNILNNPYVYAKLYFFFNWFTTYTYNNNRMLYPKVYQELRKFIDYTPYKSIMAYGFNPIKLLREIHLLFPSSIGRRINVYINIIGLKKLFFNR